MGETFRLTVFLHGIRLGTNEGVSNMIKRKGVCDVCTTEFELDEGSFGIRIMEDHLGPSSKKWTITVSNCVDGCLEEGFSQVCGGLPIQSYK